MIKFDRDIAIRGLYSCKTRTCVGAQDSELNIYKTEITRDF